ncbi:MAG: restriction endonuclease subunit R [Alphaproteobacteria bacterium CG11_big_fil_rev_8_21_14_0_20_39_49]|nr:MAG: restriction endonuclease subunit R [Alphaproteobacteria bacterium CG11_big_fil_rev_8_21_14_0_20_39_49]
MDKKKIQSLEQQVNLISKDISLLDNQRTSLTAKLQSLQLELQAEKKLQAMIPNLSVTEENIQLFMELFKGRTDVFPKRWDNQKTGKSGYSPACNNEWVRGVCNKPQIKCSDCTNQAFTEVNSHIIRRHLCGDNYGRDCTIGVYPMLLNETCWFMAVDFDGENWQRDATAFLESCDNRRVPASLEKSRSGNGGHVWIFFSHPVMASEARKMGAALITQTMERCPDIGFESYDRLFPNQDTMPSGGFGNLIALPLQKTPREKGNSLFIDRNNIPYKDQWAYLSSIRRMSASDVSTLVIEAAEQGQILGVRLPIDEEGAANPWEMRPSRKNLEIPIEQKLPDNITLVMANQLYIAKDDLPPVLINKLIRLAAFQNPEFYMAQAMRLSTFGKPRIISCAEIFKKYIGLPRGCFEEAKELLESLGIAIKIEDKRNHGTKVDTSFLGELTLEQKKAVKALQQHDTGILAATTAFGKTVVAAHVIAERKVNTLILVHRRQLLDQWVERLKVFLDIPAKDIGTIGGGKRKPTGIIDVALIQSLVRKGEVDDSIADYGQLIVDECHHLSAVSFEAVARACKARYVLGLTATVTRKDGHHPIIAMQCGQIRYRVDAKKQAGLRPFSHKVVTKHSSFQFVSQADKAPTITQLYAAIANDNARNQMIFDDVLKALESGRSPVVITERKEHVNLLAEQFSKFCKHVVIMVGGQNAKQRKKVSEQLASIPETEERLLIATGRYIGEGFDDARLDTLFLTMPVSWHGTLAQYAGRLHRLHHAKKKVVIYDYVDSNIPMLAKMAEKRRKGYERLGYEFI